MNWPGKKKKIIYTFESQVAWTTNVKLHIKPSAFFPPAKPKLLQATAIWATAWQQALPEARGEQSGGDRMRPEVLTALTLVWL